jgi:predicted porin
MLKRKVMAIAVAGAVASLASTGASALEFTAGNWKMDISGSVNAFYTNLSCDKQGGAAPVIVATFPICGTVNQDSVAIQDGLLPGYINFTASTQARGLDLKAVLGFWPGTSSANVINNTGTTPDVRTVYFQFGSNQWGSFKLGRDIGLFQQNAILNDMTLLSVGTGAGFQGAINTTLGMIGSGYIYTEFQPQITYTSPTWNGFNVAVGAFQPRNTAGVGGAADITDEVGWQGLAQFEWKGQAPGKLWASFASQQAEAIVTAVPQSTVELKGEGYEIGGKVGFAGFNLLGVYFWGEGLGEAIQFVNSHDSTGGKRDSDGYLLQGTFKIPNTDLQLGASYGQSTLDATGVDAGFLTGGIPTAPNLIRKTKSWVFQAKYDLMPGLSLIAEYVNSKQEAQLCNPLTNFGCEQEADTFAIGGIVFF